MLQTTYLYYLVKIKHYNSLSLAAEQLYVSQPALSKGIKKLEEELGVQLLNRTYKGVSLTEDGQIICELAEKAFFFLDEIQVKYPNNQQQKNRTLFSTPINLYINPNFSSILLPLFSRELENNFRLQVYNLPHNYVIEDILSMSQNNIILDILTKDYEAPNNTSLSVISHSKSYVMCPKGFPYISPAQDSISFDELLKVPLVESRTPHKTQFILMSMLREQGTPNIKFLTPDSHSAVSTAKRENLAFLTVKLFKSTENDSTSFLPIRNAPTFKLGLLYNRDLPQNTISYLTKLVNTHIW